MFDNSERKTDEFLIYMRFISYGPYRMDIDQIIWYCYWFQSQNKFYLKKELYRFLRHHDLRVYYLYGLGFLTRDEQIRLKLRSKIAYSYVSFNPVLDLGCDGDKSWFESLKGYHKWLIIDAKKRMPVKTPVMSVTMDSFVLDMMNLFSVTPDSF